MSSPQRAAATFGGNGQLDFSPPPRKYNPRPVRRINGRHRDHSAGAPGDDENLPHLAQTAPAAPSAPSPAPGDASPGVTRPPSRAGGDVRPSSRQSSHSAFSHTLPPTGLRNAPARRRPVRGGGAAPVPRSDLGSRPGSAATEDARPGTAPGDSSAEFDFEAELAAIGKMNKAEKAAQQKYVLPSTQQETQAGEDAEPPTELPEAAGGIGRPIHVPYRPDLRARMSADTHVHTHLAPKPMAFRDYHLLAEACQRAGKARMEGHAYYKMGELMAQNKDTLSKALPYFKKYLNICRRLNDLQGEAKALNCVGIVYQEMGGAEELKKSIEYHQQHSEIADAAGIFIANTNIGLIHGRLGDLGSSIEHHKQALQFAVRAGDKQAEALALANLGLMGRSQGDHSTAKVCIERHLELSSGMRDDDASCDAYEQLGMLSSEKRDWAPASDFLLRAMELSSKQGNQEKTNTIRCKIGFVNGTMRMEEHFRNIAKLMGAKHEKRRARNSQS